MDIQTTTDFFLIGVIFINFLTFLTISSMAYHLFHLSRQENGITFLMATERLVLAFVWLWNIYVDIQDLSIFGIETGISFLRLGSLIIRLALALFLFVTIAMLNCKLKDEEKC